MSRFGFGERAPWDHFPKVIRNGDLGDLQKEPEYLQAKAGDHEAALILVDRLLTNVTIDQLRSIIGDEKPVILPVIAVEESGINKIPLAMAEILADRLGLDVDLSIVQREKVGRTNAGADHRLSFNPSFDGVVIPGQMYLVMDDTLTMGGTIASLRGYIENRGGKVIGASVMTAHQGAVDLAVKPAMLVGIAQKHGRFMNDFWKETFGYEIAQLTQGEAGHLKSAASVDTIRTRIAEARNAGIERLDAGRNQTQTEQSSDGGEGVSADVLAGESLLVAAEAAEREQQALLESAPVEQLYQSFLESYVEAKHEQVERLEDRLESLISQQEAQLQSTRVNSPGLLSLPGAKRSWQVQQSQQCDRLASLHNRLVIVRDIKESVGVHAPRIEEMATRKMRAENPEVAADWDAMREAGRMHLLQQRQQDRGRGQAQGKGITVSHLRGQGE